jgi:hypothetical protein
LIEWSAEPMMPAGQNPSFGLASSQLANLLVTPAPLPITPFAARFGGHFGHVGSK